MSSYQPELAQRFGATMKDALRRLRELELRTTRVDVARTLYAAKGTIDPAYTSGLPKVTFDGQTALSTVGYPYITAYTPAAGHRVLLVPLDDGYLIVGRATGI